MNKFLSDVPSITLLIIFSLLSILNILKFITKKQFPFSNYINYLWIYFLIFSVSTLFSFAMGIWILALLCFWVLREYFSLIDIRIQDRWGIIGAYLSIPFMIYFIQIDWYGMFIISIPIYSFLVIPFLVALGGKETEGTVFSIGAIDFGLFLFVYCLGHIGYLSLYSAWMAIMLIINVTVCDISNYLIPKKVKSNRSRVLLNYVVPAPFTIIISLLLSNWAGIPRNHSLILGLMIPLLVMIGNYTISYVKSDLGITKERLRPGQGLIINNIKSVLYTAPIVFHYIRYFLK